MTERVYHLDCECCDARRVKCSHGKKRFKYFWNGLEFDDVKSWAAVVGMPPSTLRTRLEKGYCLQSEFATLREELEANRRMERERDPCSELALQFCRVMARTMRAA